MREQVAHDRRKRKTKNAVADRLRPRWEAEIPPDEREALARMSPSKLPPPLPGVLAEKPDVPELVAWADGHLFERKSVVADHELFGAALARGRGQNFTLDQLMAAVVERDYVHSDDCQKLTSKAVYARERKIVRSALDGRDKHPPFSRNFEVSANLGDEQRHAVRRILNSRDFITLFQGGAGTGKSYTNVP